MPFKEGDFIEIEYTAKNDEDGALLATTNPETAKASDAYDEHVKYGPVLVVLGSNAVVRGLEKELEKMNPGESKTFVLEAEEAFGRRDESLVRVMKESEFKAHNLKPYPGMRVNIDNAPATVKSMGSGRVVIDMNHPDSGKRIRYEVKVSRKIEKEEEKIAKLVDTYGLNPTSIKNDREGAEVFFDNKVRKDSDYFINKASSLAAIFTYMKDIKRIVVKEEYINEAAGKQEETMQKDSVRPSDE